MGRPYSMDLRERVVRAVEVDGLSRHAAAARFGLGVSPVINWVRLSSAKPISSYVNPSGGAGPSEPLNLLRYGGPGRLRSRASVTRPLPQVRGNFIAIGILPRWMLPTQSNSLPPSTPHSPC